MIYTSNVEDMIYLKERNVREIIHFTNIDNLKNIAQYGIIPRSSLNEQNISYSYNDENRYDGLNHTNFSLTNPNINMFYRIRKSNPTATYIVMSLDVSLFEDLQPQDYYFTSTNAASNDAQRVNVKELFSGYRGALPLNCPTDNQAELIIKKPVSVKFINAIYVENEFAKKIVSTILPDVHIICGNEKHAYRKGLVRDDSVEGLNDLQSIDDKINRIIENLQRRSVESYTLSQIQEQQVEVEKMLHDVYLEHWYLEDVHYEKAQQLYTQNKVAAIFDTYAVKSSYFEERHYDKSTSRKPTYWQIQYTPIVTKEKEPRSNEQLSALAVLEKILNRGRATKLSKSLEQFIVKNALDEDLIYTIRYAHQIQSTLVELLKVQKLKAGDTISIEGLDSIIAEAIVADFIELDYHVANLYRVAPFFTNITYTSSNASIIISNTSTDENYVSIMSCVEPTNFVKDFIRVQHQVDVNAEEQTLKFLLNYLFGFEEFRANQIDGIIRALHHEDSIVLLPTGSGKSIVYQLLALITPGIAFIIDPIVSLAYDQVDNLYRKGIDRVTELVADTNDKEQVEQHIGQGQYFMSFVAPERFQSQKFRDLVAYYARTNIISVIAIDEAHCVSEWGHDFRTAYLSLANTCRTICKTGNNPPPPLLALTGTASASVLRDMQRDLNILDEEAIIQPESFDRKEIEFRIINCATNRKDNVLQNIILNEIPSFFEQNASDFYTLNEEDTACGLVFCAIAGEKPWRNGNFHPFGTRHVQSLLNEWLPANSCGIYNGQVRSNEKKDNARKFKNNELLALSATKSYGMGIDKPNIRWSVHYGISSSIESYYQEAGRCARDGKKAVSWIILSNDYPEENVQLLDNTKTSIQDLRPENDRIKGSKPWEGDDISRTIFFHASSFSGIQEELHNTKFVLSYLLNNNNSVPFNGENKNKIEKTIYRLVLIGYVADYTVNYVSETIDVVVREFSVSTVQQYYTQYISGYQQDKGYLEKQLQLLQQATANFEHNEEAYLIAAVSTLLTEFTYKIVEEGRRMAMRNMLLYSTEAAAIQDPQQSGEYLRKKIVDYLSTNEEVRVQDLISKATDIPYLNTFRKKITNKKTAEKVLTQLNRLLEAYPEHFGLYYVICKLQLKYKTPGEAIQTMSTALYYGINTYNMSKNVLYQQLVKLVCKWTTDVDDYSYIIQSTEQLLGYEYVEKLLVDQSNETLQKVYTMHRFHALTEKVKETVINGIS